MMRPVLALLAIPALVACGSSGTSAPPSSETPADASAPPPSSGGTVDASAPDATIGGGTTGDAAPSPASCDGLATQPLDAVWSVPTTRTGTRSVRVHVPASYDPKTQMPLVLDFHGYSSNAEQEDFLDGMTAKANKAGFLVAQPDGLSNSWNAGICCGDSAKNGVDDMAFVNALLDMLEAKLCVDRARVFATGMSNGGFFSHRLGCQLSSRIAAIAPVAGVMGVDPCAPSRPVSVMYFHGTGDTVVPYDGSAKDGWPSAPQTFATWAKVDACTGDPTQTYQQGDVTCSTYSQCAAGTVVTLCTIDGGGHTWPGGFPIPTGKTTTSISATDAMWTFFQAHPLTK